MYSGTSFRGTVYNRMPDGLKLGFVMHLVSVIIIINNELIRALQGHFTKLEMWTISDALPLEAARAPSPSRLLIFPPEGA